jgi:uncharacterized protein
MESLMPNQKTACPKANVFKRLTFVLLSVIFLLQQSCTSPQADGSKGPDSESGVVEGYIDSLLLKRLAKDSYFADTATSPLNRSNIETFAGLRYFEPDLSYKLAALLVRDSLSEIFSMPTTTERAPRYRVYGTAYFKIGNRALQLNVFQNIDLLEKNPGSYHLFLPFKDLTNSKLTYGGGRYLDLVIPKNDTILIDFNYAYNPYCVYDDRWSCPLTPPENYLEVSINAGELNYP